MTEEKRQSTLVVCTKCWEMIDLSDLSINIHPPWENGKPTGKFMCPHCKETGGWDLFRRWY